MVLIGKRIKELRTKYKYTQNELANYLGVAKSTIAAYENDTRLPSYDILIKMSEIFKVSIDSLLLNRSDNIINVDGLNNEQIQLLEHLTAYLRQAQTLGCFFNKTLKTEFDINLLERLVKTNPEMFEYIHDYIIDIKNK